MEGHRERAEAARCKVSRSQTKLAEAEIKETLACDEFNKSTGDSRSALEVNHMEAKIQLAEEDLKLKEDKVQLATYELELIEDNRKVDSSVESRNSLASAEMSLSEAKEAVAWAKAALYDKKQRLLELSIKQACNQSEAEKYEKKLDLAIKSHGLALREVSRHQSEVEGLRSKDAVCWLLFGFTQIF
jgi:hypothetical protein